MIMHTAPAYGSLLNYTYGGLGQVNSGNKYWPGNSLVAGQQFQYGFDDIGSRQTGHDDAHDHDETV